MLSMRQLLPRRAHLHAPVHRCNHYKHHRNVNHRHGRSSPHVSQGCPGDAASAGPVGRCSAAGSPAVVPAAKYKEALFWKAVIPTALVLLVCNVDRICMSVAVIPMSQAFGWSPSVQGFIGSAFLWGYMATQLLGGQAADRYGGKLVISIAIVFFSLASLLPLASPLIPQAQVLALIVASRFLVGVGEGVVLPSMNSLVATHIPPAAKARALGLIFTGFHCGNLVGLTLSPAIITAYGWHALFSVVSLLGLPLLLLWRIVQPSSAQSSAEGSTAQSNKAPAPAQPQVPIKKLLSCSAVQAIIVANFVNHWGYFIFLSWIPAFFSSVYGLNMKASSFMAFVPWIAMAAGSSFAGVMADRLVELYPVERVRKVIQVTAFAGPGIALLLLTLPNVNSQIAMGLFTMALGIQALGQAGFVANMSDVAPYNAGQLFGLCNTFGSFAGILGVSAAGVLYEATGSFNSLFYITAALYAIGATVFGLFAQFNVVFDRKE